MAKVQDVAKFFIHLAQRQAEAGKGDLMTNLRLQKLLYFAQGNFLSRHGRPLFSDAIQAWPLGPVVKSIYHTYRMSGAQGITSDPPANDAFTPEEYDLLLDVAIKYGGYSTSALVDLTHEKDAPWAHTSQGQEMKTSEIKTYFDSQARLLSIDDILDGYPVEVL